MEHQEAAGTMDGKHSRGRPGENMTEGMAQWLHCAMAAEISEYNKR